MIKQCLIKNLYNFKEEIILDFKVSRSSKGLSHVFSKDAISNFALIYGKNNVGKTNFFRIMKEAIAFIFTDENHLERTIPYEQSETSTFEIIFENEYHEFRYGFELDFDTNRVIDEWLFSKISHSSRETLIFDRKEQSWGHRLKAVDIKIIETVQSNTLILHQFSKSDFTNEIITSALESLNEINFVFCSSMSKNEQMEQFAKCIVTIHEDEKLKKLFQKFLLMSDTDIVGFNIVKMSETETHLLNEMSKLIRASISEEERQSRIQELFQEHDELLPNMLRYNYFSLIEHGTSKDPIAIEFTHRSGAAFNFSQLSSGTKQIITIISQLISSRGVFLIDEIEAGLHLTLLDALMRVIEAIVGANPSHQILIATHQDFMLDYDFIANETKIFLSQKEQHGSVEVSYLSEFKMREYHKPSARYRMNAFGVNPNTSSEYAVASYIREIAREQYDKKNGS